MLTLAPLRRPEAWIARRYRTLDIRLTGLAIIAVPDFPFHRSGLFGKIIAGFSTNRANQVNLSPVVGPAFEHRRSALWRGLRRSAITVVSLRISATAPEE